VLLVNGADPNEMFEQGTIWESFVEHMTTQLDQGNGTRFENGREDPAWYQTAELLVKYGAWTDNLPNPRGSIVRSKLKCLFGMPSTKKLLSPPSKISQPLGQQTRPSLRHKRCFIGERQGFNETGIY
jgi:hypothetical protein